MGRLSGKVAIVTGGASGIGEGIARRFVTESARVVVADLDEGRGQALARELGADSSYVRVDVTKSADVEAMVAHADACFGRIDILVNNAGVVRDPQSIVETSERDFDFVVAVDLKGVWLATKHALPALVASGGSIINISSTSGILGMAYMTPYGAAKGGVIQLTRHLAKECGPDGVRANCICPGTTVTPLTLRRRQPKTEAEIRADFGRLNPLGRAGEPEDIAYCAVWLGSDESRFVSGQVIAIDGGMTATIPQDI